MSAHRVCHVTTVHRAEDVRIYHKEALSLAKAGYDVTVIAPEDKSSRLESVNWLRLRRPSGRFDRFLRLGIEAYNTALRLGAEVVHLHDPELLFIGWLLKQRGRKVVWDAHEDLPKQILSKEWIPILLRKPIAWVANKLERGIARSFDAVVAATPDIARLFSATQVTVVQNFPILSQLNTPNPVIYSERPNTFIYVGGISEIRGAREMVRAMEIAGERWGARLLLAGRFTPEGLKEELMELPGWKYVDYLGWLDRKEVAKTLGNVRAGMVLFHPKPNHIKAQPNKLFEYMAAGLPVIASEFPLWREIVASSQSGLLVDPLNPEAIAEAIGWLLGDPRKAEEMGNRGRQAVFEKYNWDREKEKLLALYGELLSE